MPKYGGDLVYRKAYTTTSLFANNPTSYEHRISAGYFQDMYEDRYYNQLSGANIGTTRFRYMARLSQNIFNYKNKKFIHYYSLFFCPSISSQTLLCSFPISSISVMSLLSSFILISLSRCYS